MIISNLAPYAQYTKAETLAQNDPHASISLLKTLHEQFPNDGRIAYLLGITLLKLKQPFAAISPLETAAEREQDHEHNTQEALTAAYNAANMPAHAYRAARRAGLEMPAFEEAMTGIPEGAYLGDLIDFETGRRYLLQHNGNTAEGLGLIQNFITRFPKYIPAWNVMTSGLFTQGRFSESLQVAQKVLQMDGHNLHALLNIARCARLLKGLDATRRLRAYVLSAHTQPRHEQHSVADGPLTQLQLAAILQDPELTLHVWELHPELNNPQDQNDQNEIPALLQNLRGRLTQALQSHDPESVPLLLPSNLLPQHWFNHWQEASSQNIGRLMNEQLSSIPGWFEHLPSYLMYENERMAGLFASYLLLQGDRRGSSKRFIQYLDDPHQGTPSGRLGVARTLQRFGLLPNPLTIQQLQRQAARDESEHPELSHQAPENVLTASEQQSMHKAAELMRQGDFVAAVELMEPIANMHSSNPGIQYNLSLAEIHSGNPELERRANQRRRVIMKAHPNYLYAPAALAQDAIKRGDLKHAHELLTLPSDLTDTPADAYAYFVAIQGLLALHEEEFEKVETILDQLRELVGKDTTSYKLLVHEMAKLMKNKANDLRYTKLIAKLD